MTLDSYFPLFGGFVNKKCVLGECWALWGIFDRVGTWFNFSLLPFDSGDLISVLALRELPALEQPTRSGSSQGRASCAASSGSPASPLCHQP